MKKALLEGFSIAVMALAIFMVFFLLVSLFTTGGKIIRCKEESTFVSYSIDNKRMNKCVDKKELHKLKDRVEKGENDEN
jgi:hypothetical protein